MCAIMYCMIQRVHLKCLSKKYKDLLQVTATGANKNSKKEDSMKEFKTKIKYYRNCNHFLLKIVLYSIQKF